MTNYLLYILIYISYPTSDIETIRLINDAVHNSFKEYCFLGIEYDLTSDSCHADLILDPCTDMPNMFTLGLTEGNIHRNYKLYGIPEITMSCEMSKELFERVLVHEIGHFLGYIEHSIDPQSIFYPTMHDPFNQYITRHDTLRLIYLTNYR